MVTMAQRLAPLREATETVYVRQARRRRALADPALYTAIERAFELQARLRALEPALKEAKALIAARAGELADGAATVTLEAGSALCTVSMRHEASVPEHNVGELKALLGRKFGSLVRERKKLTATRELIRTGTPETLSLLMLKELAPQFRWGLTESAGP